MQLDLELELKALQEEIVKLKSENATLKEVIVENGLEAEIPDIDLVSVEEKACIDGIGHLAKLLESGNFTKDDVKAFSDLHNTLSKVRGKSPAGKSKVKSAEVKTLLKAISGDKK